MVISACPAAFLFIGHREPSRGQPPRQRRTYSPPQAAAGVQQGPGGGKISTGNASGDRRAGTRKFSQNSKGLLTHRGEGLREFAEICIEKPGAIPARSAAAPALEDAQRPRSDRQAPPGDLPPQRVQHRPRDLRPVFTFTGCGELPSKRTTKRTKEPPATAAAHRLPQGHRAQTAQQDTSENKTRKTLTPARSARLRWKTGGPAIYPPPAPAAIKPAQPAQEAGPQRRPLSPTGPAQKEGDNNGYFPISVKGREPHPARGEPARTVAHRRSATAELL